MGAYSQSDTLLKQERIKKDISQTEMAKALSITRVTYGKIERGEHSVKKIGRLFDIVRILKTSLEVQDLFCVGDDGKYYAVKSTPKSGVSTYKGRHYMIIDKLTMKHPVTREWVNAVLYTDGFNKYVREESEFNERFEV